jgi:hypothetical protein
MSVAECDLIRVTGQRDTVNHRRDRLIATLEAHSAGLGPGTELIRNCRSSENLYNRPKSTDKAML